MAHKPKEWQQLQERLAQCEYEREDARRQWDANRLRADQAEKRIGELQNVIRSFRQAFRQLYNRKLVP